MRQVQTQPSSSYKTSNAQSEHSLGSLLAHNDGSHNSLLEMLISSNRENLVSDIQNQKSLKTEELKSLCKRISRALRFTAWEVNNLNHLSEDLHNLLPLMIYETTTQEAKLLPSYAEFSKVLSQKFKHRSSMKQNKILSDIIVVKQFDRESIKLFNINLSQALGQETLFDGTKSLTNFLRNQYQSEVLKNTIVKITENRLKSFKEFKEKELLIDPDSLKRIDAIEKRLKKALAKSAATPKKITIKKLLLGQILKRNGDSEKSDIEYITPTNYIAFGALLRNLDTLTGLLAKLAEKDKLTQKTSLQENPDQKDPIFADATVLQLKERFNFLKSACNNSPQTLFKLTQSFQEFIQELSVLTQKLQSNFRDKHLIIESQIPEETLKKTAAALNQKLDETAQRSLYLFENYDQQLCVQILKYDFYKFSKESTDLNKSELIFKEMALCPREKFVNTLNFLYRKKEILSETAYDFLKENGGYIKEKTEIATAPTKADKKQAQINSKKQEELELLELALSDYNFCSETMQSLLESIDLEIFDHVEQALKSSSSAEISKFIIVNNPQIFIIYKSTPKIFNNYIKAMKELGIEQLCRIGHKVLANIDQFLVCAEEFKNNQKKYEELDKLKIVLKNHGFTEFDAITNIIQIAFHNGNTFIITGGKPKGLTDQEILNKLRKKVPNFDEQEANYLTQLHTLREQKVLSRASGLNYINFQEDTGSKATKDFFRRLVNTLVSN